MQDDNPFSAAAQAKRLRDEASRFDDLARRAEKDGDTWDAAECRGKAGRLRRDARRFEALAAALAA